MESGQMCRIVYLYNKNIFLFVFGYFKSLILGSPLDLHPATLF
jgi:hypothetical protein